MNILPNDIQGLIHKEMHKYYTIKLQNELFQMLEWGEPAQCYYGTIKMQLHLCYNFRKYTKGRWHLHMSGHMTGHGDHEQIYRLLRCGKSIKEFSGYLPKNY